jgi:hypothetical protein
MLYRERRDFRPSLDAAARRLGFPSAAVEKDYWVTEALRGMVASHQQAFVFKGGTSLSKCLKIIDRFSEDIDILVVPGERSRNATHNLMKELAAAASERLGDPAEEIVSSETGVHRTVDLAYPITYEEQPGIRPYVRLEMGVRGGPQPYQEMSGNSLLAEALASGGFDGAAYEDLVPVTLTVLHPGRTLIEKLGLLNEAASRFEDRGAPLPPGVGRHYYDINQLMDESSSLALLEDRETFHAIVADCEAISRRHFGAQYQRPHDGFASGPAFALSERIKSEAHDAYDRAMRDLYFGSSPPPSLDDVLARIQARRALL